MIEQIKKDRDLILCVKPSGLPTTSDDGTESLKSLLEKADRDKRELFTVHRLDQAVGGIMVFARSSKAASKLSQQIQDGRMKKEYLAVVKGAPVETSGIFQDLLFKDSRKNKSFVVSRERKGVRKASLEYEVLETVTYEGSTVSLVRILLHTGRTHQIRVQFASRRMPLLGDGKYGSRDNRCDVSLWSYRLTFEAPESGEAITQSVLPPMRYPWNLFSSLNTL